MSREEPSAGGEPLRRERARLRRRNKGWISRLMEDGSTPAHATRPSRQIFSKRFLRRRSGATSAEIRATLLLPHRVKRDMGANSASYLRRRTICSGHGCISHASAGALAEVRGAEVETGDAIMSRRLISSAFHQRNNPLRSRRATRRSGTKPSYNSRQPPLCLAKYPTVCRR